MGSTTGAPETFWYSVPLFWSTEVARVSTWRAYQMSMMVDGSIVVRAQTVPIFTRSWFLDGVNNFSSRFSRKCALKIFVHAAGRSSLQCHGPIGSIGPFLWLIQIFRWLKAMNWWLIPHGEITVYHRNSSTQVVNPKFVGTWTFDWNSWSNWCNYLFLR